MPIAEPHPFDQAIALVADGPDAYTGHTSPAYWNMVGPFGGITAAALVNAVMQHPARLGEPVALTVNYAAALVAGPFRVQVRAARTNRSTQHWMLEMHQAADGKEETVLTATVMTARRRETWSLNDTPMPSVPAPEAVVADQRKPGVEWFNRYDMRFVQGAMPAKWTGEVSEGDGPLGSTTRAWVRDTPPRPLDHCALASYADVFYPRIWLRRPRPVPVGTVSMTVYFHADSAGLQAASGGYALAQALGQVFQNGFFEQVAQVWSAAGTLLLTSTQLAYYKE